MSEYPQDILLAAGEVCKAMGIPTSVVNCLPIADALIAERARNAQPRKKIIEAMCQLSHSIDDDKVEFRFTPGRSGHNALNQLVTQLEAQFGATKAEG